MYTVVEPTQEISSLDLKCKALIGRLVHGLTPLRKDLRLRPSDPIFQEGNAGGKLYLLKDGSVSYLRNGRQVFLYDEGDIIGLEHYFSPGHSSLSTDFTIVVDEYEGSTFFQRIFELKELFELWNTYLITNWALFTTLMGEMNACEVRLNLDVRSYSAGDYIIREGEPALEVFTMIEGAAQVETGGNKVGEIGADEIFGELSVFSGVRRLASVRALTECVVLTLPRENFVELIQSRPATVLKLVEDLAKTVLCCTAAESYAVEIPRVLRRCV